MFGLASGLYQSYFSTPQLNVLLLGAEGVGKTTMLERLKVTQFSNRAPVVVQATTTTAAGGVGVAPKRTFACPAPSNRYANAKLDDDDEEDEEEEYESSTLSEHQSDVSTTIKTTTKTNQWLDEKQQSSLEDIPDFTEVPQSQPLQESNQEQQLQDSSQEQQVHEDHQESHDTHNDDDDDDDEEEEVQEFNLKPGLKMLPLEKIRPTSGQNLAKVDICGAKCHIFDISGKFMDLWERYYGDADAVIFCWRLDHEEAYQRQVLEMVREEIPDDVPILIFGHEYDNVKPSENNNTNGNSNGVSTTTTLQQQLQQQRRRHQRKQMSHQNHVTTTTTTTTMTVATELFLPNYHSNMMNAITGSAKTGQGIREAMEWLIPLAKRQAKMRAQEAAVAVHYHHYQHHPTKTTATARK